MAVPPVLAAQQVLLEQVMPLAQSWGTLCSEKGTICLSDSPKRILFREY